MNKQCQCVFEQTTKTKKGKGKGKTSGLNGYLKIPLQTSNLYFLHVIILNYN